jgi:hypothetical protein
LPNFAGVFVKLNCHNGVLLSHVDLVQCGHSGPAARSFSRKAVSVFLSLAVSILNVMGVGKDVVFSCFGFPFETFL